MAFPALLYFLFLDSANILHLSMGKYCCMLYYTYFYSACCPICLSWTRVEVIILSPTFSVSEGKKIRLMQLKCG